ncbi:MAG TPA: hypothetical protein VLR46_04230 [Candidatus Dormibacteraeota bacterium]|nr:hypothetical protein [Candidatus Dormibacteraeota bacterium]
MNKRPGHVVVTTEVAMCSFCGRPRNLRNEQHQLGTLVRTIVTCETCHRTLSSEISVAGSEAAAAEPVDAPVETEPTPASAAPAKTETAKTAAKPASKPATKPAARRTSGASATKSTASKSRTPKKSG